MTRVDLRRDVKVGLAWGAWFAGGFSLWATVLRLVAGEAPFRKIEMRYWQVVLAYALGGLTGGMVFGLLRRFVRGRFTAALVGFLVAVPVFSGMLPFMFPRSKWLFPGFPAVVGSALLLGVPLGISFYDEENPPARR